MEQMQLWEKKFEELGRKYLTLENVLYDSAITGHSFPGSSLLIALSANRFVASTIIKHLMGAQLPVCKDEYNLALTLAKNIHVKKQQDEISLITPLVYQHLDKSICKDFDFNSNRHPKANISHGYEGLHLKFEFEAPKNLDVKKIENIDGMLLPNIKKVSHFCELNLDDFENVLKNTAEFEYAEFYRPMDKCNSERILKITEKDILIYPHNSLFSANLAYDGKNFYEIGENCETRKKESKKYEDLFRLSLIKLLNIPEIYTLPFFGPNSDYVKEIKNSLEKTKQPFLIQDGTLHSFFTIDKNQLINLVENYPKIHTGGRDHIHIRGERRPDGKDLYQILDWFKKNEPDVQIRLEYRNKPFAESLFDKLAITYYETHRENEKAQDLFGIYKRADTGAYTIRLEINLLDETMWPYQLDALDALGVKPVFKN